MGQYIIPANSKKGVLIFGIWTWLDVGIVATGICLSLILLFAIGSYSVFAMLLKFLPAAIALLITIPIPQYHNVRIYIREAKNYFLGQKKYKWRGWCASIEYGKDEDKN